MSPLPIIGIALHLADEGPVGLAGVHLRAGAAVDGQGGDARVLQPFGKADDALGVLVPAQPRLDGDGDADGLDHGLGDAQQLGDVAQHAGSGALARNLFDGAAEVDVEQFGPGLFDNARRLDHGLHLAAVDLDAHGAFAAEDVQLAARAFDVANQGVGTDELGVHEVGAILLAERAEGHVGDVFHGRQQQRHRAQVERTYNHIRALFRLVVDCKAAKLI